MPDSCRHPVKRRCGSLLRVIPILPLHSVTEAGGCTCGNSDCESVGKHPFAPLAPHGLKDATVDTGIIRAWFEKHYWLGYGIVTDELLVDRRGCSPWRP